LDKVEILIVEDDAGSESALRQMLDSEGWQVEAVSLIGQALSRIASRNWSLVIVNIGMIRLDGPIYLTLKELALAPAVENGKSRARILFLVPEDAAIEVPMALTESRLAFVAKPFHFHDLLEKVSDLLMEMAALSAPIRRVTHDASASERKRNDQRREHESHVRKGRRDTGMFASRESYVMTEEEMNDYEKEELAQRKKSPPQGY